MTDDEDFEVLAEGDGWAVLAYDDGIELVDFDPLDRCDGHAVIPVD